MDNRIIWEYNTILTIEASSPWQFGDGIKEKLNKAGADGWELVTAIPSSEALEPLFIFKRPMAIKHPII